MAESLAQQTIKKIDSKLECSICLEPYKEPKLLPCFHVFCKSPCLEKLIKRDRQGNSSLVCPNCRHFVTLSEKGVAGLQSDFHIDHLVEVREFLDRAHHTDSTAIKCENCTAKEPAQGFCRDCQKLVCASCIDIHSKWVALTSHKIMSLAEVTAEASKMISPIKKISYCPKHSEAPLRLFCATCSELICMDCIVRLHRNHSYDLLDDLLAQYKAEITSSLEPVRENIQTVNKTLNKFDENARAIDDEQAKMEADIHKKIDKLHQNLDQRRGELIRQLDLLIQQRRKALAMHRNEVEVSLAKHRSCLEYAEGGLETGSPAEVVAMKGAVLKRVSEITAEFNPVTVQPQAGPALVLLADEEKVKEACAEFAVITLSIEISMLKKKKFDPVLTNTKSEAECFLVTQVNKPFTDPVTVTGEIVHVKSGETAAVEVTGKEGNKHTLSITPVHRGRHELRVSINGQPLKASPLSVAPHPDSLGKPTSVIGGLNSPWGVAINSKGHIVAADMNSDQICILERDGTKVQSFGTEGDGNGEFNVPADVTVDSRDNMYIADSFNNYIQKFSPNGQFLASVDTEGDEKLAFNNPTGIAYNKLNNRLYVCDCCNNRIQVLTSDLAFHHTFGEEGDGNGQFDYPNGVCCDDIGNVFVADENNNRVQVFTVEGEFVRVIGKDRLKEPLGVTVSAGVLYVTEGVNGEHISMFTLTGEFIGSFGDDSFYGVAVDQEETIIVINDNGVDFF